MLELPLRILYWPHSVLRSRPSLTAVLALLLCSFVCVAFTSLSLFSFFVLGGAAVWGGGERGAPV